MNNLLKLLLLFQIVCFKIYAQGGASSCAQLEANYQAYQSCATSIPFSNSVGGNNEFFNTSCIPTAFVGPTWFFIEIKDPGNVILQISQTNSNGNGADVDFVLWGPFTNLTNVCSQLNQSKEKDCSYSSAAVETVSIPSSTTGQLYVLLIDNYSGQSGQISVSQIGGSGTTNCDFLSTVKINNTDGTPINNLDSHLCYSDTKQIMATIDVNAFTGNVSDLRFNYTWYKDGVQIGTPILNDSNPTNTITVTSSGTYKVETTTYDIVNNPDQDNPIPAVSEAEVDLFFHTTPDVAITLNGYSCVNTNPQLTSSIFNSSALVAGVDNLTYQWYLDNNPISGATSQNYSPTQVGEYFVKVTNSPCPAINSNVIQIIENPVIINNPNTLVTCSTSEFATFNLEENENAITASTTYPTVSFKYFPSLNEAIANTNQISNPSNFVNTNPYNQTIYIRVATIIDTATNEECFLILEQELIVKPYLENVLSDEPYTICYNAENNIAYPVEVKTNLNETNYEFIWYNGFNAVAGNEITGATSNSFTTSNLGSFSVQITDITGATPCASIFNFTTQTSPIPQTVTASPSELIAFDTENTVVATAIPNSADYLYAIDNGGEQESNIFYNVPPGKHFLKVINKYGCGETKTVFTIVDYPKFFTPNGDSFNDYWNIRGTSLFDTYTVSIFDRYGKLITQIRKNTPEWDGTLNGQLLPASDYWFRLVYTIDNVEYEYRNHFTLKR
jgi:gliding motility-associated-like protein